MLPTYPNTDFYKFLKVTKVSIPLYQHTSEPLLPKRPRPLMLTVSRSTTVNCIINDLVRITSLSTPKVDLSDRGVSFILPLVGTMKGVVIEENTENGSKLRIRLAEATDVSAVMELFKRHLQDMGVEPDAELDADMSNFSGYYLKTGNVFIVVEALDGNPVAMGGIGEGVVRRLHVSRSWRGQHIATMVIRHLLNWYRSHHSNEALFAVVDRNNRSALRVFERCGFVLTDREPEDIRQNQCNVMEWRNADVMPNRS